MSLRLGSVLVTGIRRFGIKAGAARFVPAEKKLLLKHELTAHHLPQFRVSIIGSGTGDTAVRMSPPAIVLGLASRRLLFDCGDGTVKEMNQSVEKIRTIRW